MTVNVSSLSVREPEGAADKDLTVSAFQGPRLRPLCFLGGSSARPLPAPLHRNKECGDMGKTKRVNRQQTVLFIFHP